jgi:hypothetical protein
MTDQHVPGFFEVVGTRTEDRNTLLFDVEPQIPLSQYPQVVVGVDASLKAMNPGVVGIEPGALAGMQRAHTVSVARAEGGSVVRMAFSGFLERHEAPARQDLRGLATTAVSQAVALIHPPNQMG